MDGKQKLLIGAVGVALGLLLVACVTASSCRSGTPLFTFRMEQASNKMNFLPTAVNGFVYSTEKGYTVHYSAAGYGDAQPLKPPTEVPTCPYTCDDDTCEETCPYTCWSTCPSTCESTCPNTCDGPTCWSSCRSRCPPTQVDTCWETCDPCDP